MYGAEALSNKWLILSVVCLDWCVREMLSHGLCVLSHSQCKQINMAVQQRRATPYKYVTERAVILVDRLFCTSSSIYVPKQTQSMTLLIVLDAMWAERKLFDIRIFNGSEQQHRTTTPIAYAWNCNKPTQQCQNHKAWWIKSNRSAYYFTQTKATTFAEKCLCNAEKCLLLDRQNIHSSVNVYE